MMKQEEGGFPVGYAVRTFLGLKVRTAYPYINRRGRKAAAQRTD